MPISIALADDHTLFLTGLRMILARFPNLKIIHAVQNGAELLNACSRRVPDVVLLDLKMPVLDGIETTRQLRAKYPDVKIILLTLQDSPRMITYLMELGANGYLLKNEKPEVVYDAIQATFERGFYFNDYVGKALLQARTLAAPPVPTTCNGKPTSAPRLSRRELEVLELICQQHTTAEIARKLFITPRTVEGHRKNLLEKTESRNVAGLVVYAMQHGLYQPTS